MDADIKVGSVECSSVAGAIENGTVQFGRVLRVASIDRGGCVDGVRRSFVRAISIGARMMLAMPAADTASVKDAKGEGEDSISRPPA